MGTSIPDVLRADQRVFLWLDWAGFEQLLAIRGDAAGPRLTYADGRVELMSPGPNHERIKSLIGRLVSTWALHRGIDICAYGSWTIKDASVDRGVEPDECYVLGEIGDRVLERPDLAIEVVWSHGGIEKLGVYGPLRVPEVWRWEDGRLEVHVLVGDAYVRQEQSALLPDLDVQHLASFLDRLEQTRACREYLASLSRAGG